MQADAGIGVADIGARIHTIGTDARAGARHVTDMAACAHAIGADIRACADRTDMRAGIEQTLERMRAVAEQGVARAR